jgi:hypothetical protein
MVRRVIGIHVGWLAAVRKKPIEATLRGSSQEFSEISASISTFLTPALTSALDCLARIGAPHPCLHRIVSTQIF